MTSGDITLDGVDIREVKQHELREKLGYVPQKGVLFSGDIASNIMFGNSHGSDDEMIEAAEIAQATEFIDTKPEKYKSPISQGGSNVSGGQKQRLSIARAIAKHPQVFIFDDSFSALDYKTDVTLRRALAEKTSGSTVLIVAQRISTILHADQILVLNDGRIVGKGTHEELLRGCETYREIARSQMSAKELGMDSLAITDHGVMYGVIDFYKKAKEVGIKPILGCEIYVAPGSRFDREQGRGEDRYYHLVLLAENNQGYKNLMKIVTRGFTEGYYYKPRVDYEVLEKYHEGIIALSACLAGEIPNKILKEDFDGARAAANKNA